jgi:hypothetical protein
MFLCVPEVMAAPLPAEYAVRWSPTSTASPSAAAVVEMFGIKGGESESYAVSYFDVSSPKDAPKGMSAILRQRVKGSKTELTWKYRGDEAFAKTAGSPWRCPLIKPSKQKEELDVSFLPGDKVKRAYSRSCSTKQSFETSGVLAFGPKPKGCESKVTRHESKDGDFKVEQWELQNGQTLIELSWNATDSAENLKRFNLFVTRLKLAGAQPLDRSKTDIGGECKS